MKTQFYRFVVEFMLFIFCVSANGAEISIVKTEYYDVLEISGDIKNGDYKKLKNLLLDKPENFVAFQSLVQLDSIGGDVEEALKIGKLIKKNFSTTIVDVNKVCLSSCFLIWSGGVDRIYNQSAKLGVHRLALSSKEININKTEKLTTPISKKVDIYLKENGIPSKVIDRMNETSPSDIYLITSNWLIKEDLVNSMQSQPSFIEVVEKECGPGSWVLFKHTGKVPDEEFIKNYANCEKEVQIKNQDMVEQDVRKLLKER